MDIKEGWVVIAVDAGKRAITMQPVSVPPRIPALPFSGRNPSPRDRTLVISNPAHWDSMMNQVNTYHGFFFEDGGLLIPAHVTGTGKVVPLEEGPDGWSDSTCAAKRDALEALAAEAKQIATSPDEKAHWENIIRESKRARSQGAVMTVFFQLSLSRKLAGLPDVTLDSLGPQQS